MINPSHKYFISYSRADTKIATQLAEQLRDRKVDLWIDQLDIPAGDRWDSAIERALQVCSGLIVLLSKTSVNSENVLDEVSYALEENEKVIPVLLEPCDIPFRLRRLQYVDLSTSYEKGFERLLRDVRPTEGIANAPLEPAADVPSQHLPAAHEVTTQSNRSFIIGGLSAAALFTAVVVGFIAIPTEDGERPSEIASSTDVPEQSTEASDSETLNVAPASPTETETTAEPPISTAPVYVEATATGEAWVSIIADGNPIFEGKLNAGDTQLWEAQKKLSVYSGNAGALDLAANGGEAEVMGAPGQPQEKLFP
ncbi:MAG: RodZ domain-containing protein [Phormidesmis sp.]